jgi:hypothetical protein
MPFADSPQNRRMAATAREMLTAMNSPLDVLSAAAEQAERDRENSAGGGSSYPELLEEIDSLHRKNMELSGELERSKNMVKV